MDKFELANYKQDILGIAKEQKVTPVEALSLFTQNLTTMQEYHTGANSEINYHSIGQIWNSLFYKEKIRQKDSMITELTDLGNSPIPMGRRNGKE